MEKSKTFVTVFFAILGIIIVMLLVQAVWTTFTTTIDAEKRAEVLEKHLEGYKKGIADGQRKSYEEGMQVGEDNTFGLIANQLRQTGELRIKTNEGMLILAPKENATE